MCVTCSPTTAPVSCPTPAPQAAPSGEETVPGPSLRLRHPPGYKGPRGTVLLPASPGRSRSESDDGVQPCDSHLRAGGGLAPEESAQEGGVCPMALLTVPTGPWRLDAARSRFPSGTFSGLHRTSQARGMPSVALCSPALPLCLLKPSRRQPWAEETSLSAQEDAQMLLEARSWNEHGSAQRPAVHALGDSGYGCECC